jgi:hypothetical protein
MQFQIVEEHMFSEIEIQQTEEPRKLPGKVAAVPVADVSLIRCGADSLPIRRSGERVDPGRSIHSSFTFPRRRVRTLTLAQAVCPAGYLQHP